MVLDLLIKIKTRVYAAPAVKGLRGNILCKGVVMVAPVESFHGYNRAGSEHGSI